MRDSGAAPLSAAEIKIHQGLWIRAHRKTETELYGSLLCYTGPQLRRTGTLPSHPSHWPDSILQENRQRAGGRNLFSHASVNWQSLGFQARINKRRPYSQSWNSPIDSVCPKKLDYETKVNSILMFYLHHLLICGAFDSVFKKRRLWLQYNQAVNSAGEPVDCKELNKLVGKVGDTWFGEPSVVNTVSSNSWPVPS